MSGLPVVSLTRKAHFSAGHRLHTEKLSAEENVRCFAKCAHGNGHGHNYNVEVTVRGGVDPVNGMVMNLTDLTAAMDLAFMKSMDHKNLDKDVDFFKDVVSTTENVSVYIWNKLKENLENPKLLHKVKVWSTEKNSATYKGLTE